ncbi:hypothetical protein AKJ09_01436 [Labilithrix luteola]|uniref:Uncharacterized protein n=1 Tax=Labilithrix luteola TaxID=1391654 RepID=A0A0K1PMN4_9BACT|nr:hypothetical protein AKJ09_01436 [Labilithrix luteola]
MVASSAALLSDPDITWPDLIPEGHLRAKKKNRGRDTSS